MTPTICPECHLTLPCFGDHTPPPAPAPQADVVLFARRPTRPQPPRLRERPPVARPRDGEKCEHQPPDRYVCRDCLTRYTALLHKAPMLMVELEVALTKQARMGDGGGGAGLPYAPISSEQAWATRQTLLTWVDEITSIRGHTIPDTWTGIATYLREATGWLAMHPAGWWIVDEITDALTAAERVIDRPPDRVFVGSCDALVDIDGTATTCGATVYGRPGAPAAVCRRCGTAHDVKTRRDRMLDSIMDKHLTATDLSRAVNGILGTDTIAVTTIWKWASLGHITPTGTGERGRPTYLVRDVVHRALGHTTPDPATERTA